MGLLPGNGLLLDIYGSIKDINTSQFCVSNNIGNSRRTVCPDSRLEEYCRWQRTRLGQASYDKIYQQYTTKCSESIELGPKSSGAICQTLKMEKMLGEVSVLINPHKKAIYHHQIDSILTSVNVPEKKRLTRITQIFL